jgi:hypothetical protein
MSRIALLVLATVGWVVAASFATAQNPAKTAGSPAGTEPPVHTFGKKVLYVVTRPRDAHSDVGYAVYEQAEVVRLGTPSFLVGKVPDWKVEDEVNKITKGAHVWTPVAEIIQITEFDSLEKAKEFFELAGKAAAAAEADPEG